MSNVDVQGQSTGDVMRRLHQLERKIQELQAGRRLEAAAIGAGGIRVRGGRILAQDSELERIFEVTTEPPGIFMREELIQDIALAILANRLETDGVTLAGQTSAVTPNWVDLTLPGSGDPSPGPAVATTVGPAGKLVVSLSARLSINIDPGNTIGSAHMSAEIVGPDGAVSSWPSQSNAVVWSSTQNFMAAAFGRTFVVPDLTPGAYTVTAKYQASDTDDVAQFSNRALWVLAF